MGDYVTYSLNAFLITTLSILWLRPIAGQLGLVDRPGLRKHHQGAVPICGGLAMLAAFAITNIVLQFSVGVPFVAGVCIVAIAVTGLIDDRTPLPAVLRLVVHLVAATVLVATQLSGPIGVFSLLPPGLAALELLAPLIGVLFIVGTINAVNMIDGVDGLAGGYLTFSFFWLALIAEALDRPDIAIEALMLMSAVLGFLMFNLRHPWRARAAVFMGDAGSTLLGAAIAYLIVKLASGSHGASLFELCWLVIVPVTDTLVVMSCRIAAGHSPFRPDRTHLHHLLQQRGLSPAQTTMVLMAISACCGAIAYLGVLFGIEDGLMIGGLLVPIAIHVAVVASTRRRIARAAQLSRRRQSMRETTPREPAQ